MTALHKVITAQRLLASPGPNAMCLATADQHGRPSARMVLLKGIDGRCLRFFTNLNSRKAEHLNANPYAALVFYWDTIDEQIRIEGRG